MPTPSVRLALACALACCAACRTPAPAPTPSPLPSVASVEPGNVHLLATAELHGTTEPCGCNSDPLGDLARIAGLASGGLWLDAGDLLYDQPTPPESQRAQADRKAETIARVYGDAKAESAFGPSDTHSFGGTAKLELPRQICNAPVAAFGAKAAAPTVRDVNGLRVGVFGVVDPARFVAARDPLPLPVRKALALPEPAAEAAKVAVDKLRSDGAEVIVGLLSMNRAEARKLLLAVPGIDFGIIGLEVGDGMPEAEPVNGGWLLAPADQGRKVARLDIVRRDAPARAHVSLVQWEGAAGRALAMERLDKRKKALQAQLDAWKTDPSADPVFVAARKAELAELSRQSPTAASPPAGPYFSYSLVPIKRALPRDPKVAAALKQLDAEIGRANFAAAAQDQPPPALPGKPSYVGGAACARCHKAAFAFWQKSHHADAWKSLVDAGKQYNYDCIGCHVTGWQAPGGSLLGTVEKQGLVNVQCEICHGPGSKHVEELGMDDPKTLAKGPPNDLCAGRCHTKEHSDTFVFDAYLRDIVGPGHGEARRKALGDGPTGHELRSRALAEAKK